MAVEIFAFGSDNDPIAWKIADKLNEENKREDLVFVKTDNTEDLMSIQKGSTIVVIDGAMGLTDPKILDIDDLDSSKKITAHDLDLGVVLILLESMGKIGRVFIIGVPIETEDFDSVFKNVKILFDKLDI